LKYPLAHFHGTLLFFSSFLPVASGSSHSLHHEHETAEWQNQGRQGMMERTNKKEPQNLIQN
jgi:hypothetical protein